jgi:hypothetical protein
VLHRCASRRQKSRQATRHQLRALAKQSKDAAFARRLL